MPVVSSSTTNDDHDEFSFRSGGFDMQHLETLVGFPTAHAAVSSVCSECGQWWQCRDSMRLFKITLLMMHASMIAAVPCSSDSSLLLTVCQWLPIHQRRLANIRHHGLKPRCPMSEDPGCCDREFRVLIDVYSFWLATDTKKRVERLKA